MDRKILFHYGGNMEEFKRRDFELLDKHFEVIKKGVVSPFNSLSFVRTFFQLLSVDLTFSWFGSPSTFWVVILSKILGIKSVVVAGGGDIAECPEINYGGMLHPLSRIFCVGSFLFADKVLAVSKHVKEGVKKYVSDANVEIVYNGVKIDKFRLGENKDNFVLTVGYISNTTLQRKGLRTFVETAQHLAGVDFVLIGEQRDDSIEKLKSIAPKNVKFTGWISFEKLLDYMQRAKVYVQVSAHEGFGISLAEAMVCGCTPVVTERGAIPEVVGEMGYYVPYNNPEATASAVKKALSSPTGKKVRERIIDRFPLEKREKGMIELIEELE